MVGRLLAQVSEENSHPTFQLIRKGADAHEPSTCQEHVLSVTLTVQPSFNGLRGNLSPRNIGTGPEIFGYQQDLSFMDPGDPLRRRSSRRPGMTEKALLQHGAGMFSGDFSQGGVPFQLFQSALSALPIDQVKDLRLQTGGSFLSWLAPPRILLSRVWSFESLEHLPSGSQEE